MDKEQVDEFPNDAIVSIKISGAFYKRLAKMMFDFANTVTPDQFTKMLVELKGREPKDDTEFNILTLLILIAEIERQVKETGVFEKVDVPTDPDEETPDEDLDSDHPQPQ
jgi:hypothetical protein